jgi:hypothetical protein
MCSVVAETRCKDDEVVTGQKNLGDSNLPLFKVGHAPRTQQKVDHSTRLFIYPPSSRSTSRSQHKSFLTSNIAADLTW